MPQHIITEDYEHYEKRQKSNFKRGLPVFLGGVGALILSTIYFKDAGSMILGAIISMIIVIIGYGIMKG